EVLHQACDDRRVAGLRDTDVDLRGAFGGDDVGTRAALDDPDVYRPAFAEVGEAGDGLHQARHLEHGGVAGLEVDTGVRSDAGDAEIELADTLAGRFVGEA